MRFPYKRSILLFFALVMVASPFQRVHSALPVSFPLNARQFHTWIWNPTNNCRIYGRFEASGGARNDVEVFLMTSDEMQNFQNGNRANTIYQSGRVTVGNLDVRVPPGSYNIVFQSPDPSMRIVTTDIAAEW